MYNESVCRTARGQLSRDLRDIPLGTETAIIPTVTAAVPWQRTASWNHRVRSAKPSTRLSVLINDCSIGTGNIVLYRSAVFSRSAAGTYLLIALAGRDASTN